jgi:hypothetical protein
MDYREALKKIYKPDIGSIWKAPNNIWTTGFANNKEPYGIHPSIVEKLHRDGFSAQLAPGTTKDYQKGSCVFKVDIGEKGVNSYFLLNLSMPYSISELLDLPRGWNGVDVLSEDQIKKFDWQIEICKG